MDGIALSQEQISVPQHHQETTDSTDYLINIIYLGLVNIAKVLVYTLQEKSLAAEKPKRFHPEVSQPVEPCLPTPGSITTPNQVK